MHASLAFLIGEMTDKGKFRAEPNDFVNRYWHNLSRDKNGEMKFNVVKETGGLHLKIPQPVGLVDVSDFVSPDLLVAPQRPQVF